MAKTKPQQVLVIGLLLQHQTNTYFTFHDMTKVLTKIPGFFTNTRYFPKFTETTLSRGNRVFIFIYLLSNLTPPRMLFRLLKNVLKNQFLCSRM